MDCGRSIQENEGIERERTEKGAGAEMLNGKSGKIMINKVIILMLALFLFMLSGCRAEDAGNEPQKGQEQKKAEKEDPTEDETGAESQGLVAPEGMTLETRIKTPEGYVRKEAKKDSLSAFLRGYALKEDGSPVFLYNGKEKKNQTAHQAVFALPIEEEDLQQCADSIMRVYAEYFRETGQEEKIGFHFVSGFYAEYSKWREGYRIKVSGNDVSWEKSAGYDDSYESFQKYLRVVFSYAGTLSMEAESEEIPLSDIACGDVFLKGGSPGHVVLVADVCENEEGQKAFLLAQGYMPAQEFHLLKNPLNDGDPWYYEQEVKYPFATPEYRFPEGSLKRLSYQR